MVVSYRGAVATHWTLGCDAEDPHRLAAFWALALGYVPEPGYDDEDGASIVDPDGVGPAIGFLRVPEGKTAKNRLHFDLRPTGRTRAEEVARAIGLGARQLADHTRPDGGGWVSLLDPEGNEFCIERGDLD